MPTDYYGVLCHTCKMPIILATIEETGPHDIAFYAVPVEAQTCGKGHKGLYGSKDARHFRVVTPGRTDTAQRQT